MKEIEKMRSEMLYDFSDPEIHEGGRRARKICAQLQTVTVDDEEYRPLMELLIPSFPKSAVICTPFHCDQGHGISIGEGTFVNYNAVMLDTGRITIGSHCQIGPNCSFYTPQHPKNYIERRETKETAYPISIGDDTWLGGNVTVLPGVKIGSRCIIGAGSVVIKDIPDDSVAVGNPARVIKLLK